MFRGGDFPPYVHFTVPNRALGPAGRRWFLGLVAATTLGVAAGLAALGAWPGMPFAGIEGALVALPVHIVRLHDADFERVEVGRHRGKVRRREARLVARL